MNSYVSPKNEIHPPLIFLGVPPQYEASQVGYTYFVSHRLHLKYDGTRAEIRFRLSAKRTCSFISAKAAVECASAVAMPDTPCFVVVWTVLATQSIRQFLLHFPSRASPCAITFHLASTQALSFVTNSHLYRNNI